MALIGKKPCTFIDNSLWEFSEKNGKISIDVLKRRPPGRTLIFPNTGNSYISSNFKYNLSTQTYLDVIDLNGNFLGDGVNPVTFPPGLTTRVLKGFNPKQVDWKELFVNWGVGSYEDIPNGVSNMDGCFAHSGINRFPTLPKNIQSLNSTFDGCVHLADVLDIPPSVTDLSGCFCNCISLRYGVRSIPAKIRTMRGAYEGCRSLRSAGVLPKEVYDMCNTFQFCSQLSNIQELPKKCVSMNATFNGCEELRNIPTLPEGLLDLGRAFNRTGLVYAPKIPDTVLNMDRTFCGCVSLAHPSDIPDSVLIATEVYKNTSIKKAPKLGKSIVDARNMFAHCEKLKIASDLPDSVITANGMYMDTAIARPPKLNKNLEEMDIMFIDCSRLLAAPIIPPKVTSMHGAFLRCGNIEGDLIITSKNVYIRESSLKSFYFLMYFKVIYVPLHSKTHDTINRVVKEAGFSHVKVRDIEEHIDYEKIKKEYIDE